MKVAARYCLLLFGIIAACVCYYTFGAEDKVPCQELFKFNGMISVSKEVSESTVNWVSLKEGTDSFSRLDIDEDGKEDTAIRACGNGADKLCKLLIKLSSGGKMETAEGPPFHLLRYKGNIYMVETYSRDSERSSYRKMTIYKLKLRNILNVCRVSAEYDRFN